MQVRTPPHNKHDRQKGAQLLREDEGTFDRLPCGTFVSKLLGRTFVVLMKHNTIDYAFDANTDVDSNCEVQHRNEYFE